MASVQIASEYKWQASTNDKSSNKKLKANAQLTSFQRTREQMTRKYND